MRTISCYLLAATRAGAVALTLIVTAQTPAKAAPSRIGSGKVTAQLFQAVHGNDMSAVQETVREGADVDATDRWGMTPIDIAIDRGYYKIAHFLVSVRNVRRSQEEETTAMRAQEPEKITPLGGRAPFVSPQLRQEASHKTTHATPTAQFLDALSTSAGPASAEASVTPSPQTASTSADIIPALSGPNPFDPNTPAWGSQLRSDAAP